ncbi:myeloid protein 1-like isoform X2 [Stegostoma tigrinum]|uniref:myeloid protein 1-like isoform X2 n=1 Tax=Stegostoma tigrinum TaxID=3053191 RepID=UPI00202AFCF7|nr:myeloid protein 1-like isoform X2 [Stegostoma tigrinum]XP_059498567.1 myeloid protein 1-like isoform X2 [Stegostoma tigrinum]
MFKGLIFLFLFSHVAARHWDRLCGGNPTNQVRGTDIYGSGAYGAPRDNDRHLGVDVICKEGSVIYAPFSGRLIRRANPYNNGNAIDNGVMMRGPGSCVKMYNFQPDRYTGRISKGRRLGTLLNVQAVFPEITSHVHIEMCDTSIDPTPNL